jgi:hypothetical protein
MNIYIASGCKTYLAMCSTKHSCLLACLSASKILHILLVNSFLLNRLLLLQLLSCVCIRFLMVSHFSHSFQFLLGWGRIFKTHNSRRFRPGLLPVLYSALAFSRFQSFGQLV